MLIFSALAICYSCIAPLILVFAGLGMGFIYFVYKYNLIYSYDSDIDTKGLLYPKALMQLFVGLYMSEICLIGLFALHTAFGPLLLMILFLVFTAMIHISLSDALGPLLNNLPRTLALQDQSLAEDSTPDDNINPPNNSGTPPEVQGGTASDYYNMEEGFGMETSPHGAPPEVHGGTANDYYNAEEGFGIDTTRRPHPEPATRNTNRSIEGAGGFMSSIGKFAWLATSTKINAQAEESGLTLFLARVMAWITPDINKKPNFLIKFLHPEVYEDYHILREMMPPEPPEVELPEQYLKRGYFPPEMWTPTPKLWIPRDEARVSRQEVAHTRESVPISDRGAWLDERGRIEVDVNMAPFKEPRILY